MTPAILIMISMMWIPLGMLFLGKGEAKSCGFMTSLVGTLTLIGALYQSANNDLLTGAALFVFGILYLSVGYALMTGVEDMRSVANAALVVAIVCAITTVLTLPGAEAVAPSYFLSFMFAAFTVLCIAVFMNGYGKVSGTVVAWLLIIQALVCLLWPGFSLISKGAFPF